MNAGVQSQYLEYRDSGIAWLQEMPAHWSLLKTKRIFSRVQRPVRNFDGIVTAFRDGEVTLRSNRRVDGFTNAVKEIGYQGVRAGDLVVHAMDGFAGAIGVSDSDGKCSPVCSVCVPSGRHEIDVSFYGRLVRQLAITDFITSLAKGIRERSTEFRFSEFAIVELPVPPKPEQTKIAEFLDHETAKIDALIEKQQQLIALLKEKRQAVISHAVTKGLNPDAPMRDSGVEWLGEIPAHWTVRRAKYLFHFVTSGSRGWADFYADEGPIFFRIANLTRDTIEPKIESVQRVLPPHGSEGERSRIKSDDILISITADLGSVCVANDSIAGGYVSQHVSLCRPNGVIGSSRWFGYAILSTAVKEQLLGSGYGGTKVQLSLEDIRELILAMPESAEQSEIATHIDAKMAKFSMLIEAAEAQVLLLQERRTALISAAVTGKIDVRGWKPPESEAGPEAESA